MKITAFIFCICIVALSCYSNLSDTNSTLGKSYEDGEEIIFAEQATESPRTQAPPPPPPQIEEVAEEETLEESKIIKSGSMTLEVENLENRKKELDSIVHKFNAYYSNENYHSYKNKNTYHLTIRVPQSLFTDIIRTIESGKGKLISKNIRSQNVTEEYLDLNIRLENNLAYLKRYQTILEKANSIKEILEIQNKIRRIEEEIESKKGRLKYLNNKIKYSTLSIEINELTKDELVSDHNFLSRLWNSFNSGVQEFLNFIIYLVGLWPFLIILTILFLTRKKILRLVDAKFPGKK